jgi:phage terminase large subunit-like protein
VATGVGRVSAVAAERPRLIGSERPRIFTPPLRRLTPKTTRGYDVIAFAEGLGVELMPWQKWALIHGLELRPDGRYRFRYVLVLVARQNGKTTLLQVLTLWRMVHQDAERAPLILGTSTSIDYAREAWGKVVELAQRRDKALFGDEQDPDRWLNPVEKWSVKRGALDTSMTLQTNRARYRVATASRTGGRSLSVDLGITDELREHRPKGDSTGWEAWAAISGTITAAPDPQIWALSNAGDASSVVLNTLQGQCHEAIESGTTADTDTCLMEYSAEPDCDVMDRRQWRWANPALGHTITEEFLVGASKFPAAVFRTEHLCIGVQTLDGAIPGAAWRGCVDPGLSLAKYRRRVVCVIDVSEDLEHVTLIAAAVGDDDRARVDVVAAWESPAEAEAEIVKALARVKPRQVGWFPTGPAGAIAGAMKRAGRKFRVVELGEVEQKQACQGLFQRVQAGGVAHGDDPLLNAHIASAGKQLVGDGWRFRRRGAGRIDAAYAAAGAVHLAVLLPRPRQARGTFPRNTPPSGQNGG